MKKGWPPQSPRRSRRLRSATCSCRHPSMCAARLETARIANLASAECWRPPGHKSAGRLHLRVYAVFVSHFIIQAGQQHQGYEMPLVHWPVLHAYPFRADLALLTNNAVRCRLLDAADQGRQLVPHVLKRPGAMLPPERGKHVLQELVRKRLDHPLQRPLRIAADLGLRRVRGAATCLGLVHVLLEAGPPVRQLGPVEVRRALQRE
eukprot:scaffold301_cov243-Pinguiococcus_pyrenoidosus.AAC.49